ncbi:MAG: dTDP-Rha--alpha-D-GlcNAc-pyrophosphate polyprenol alpha-3-L-rhamnosyltransferase [Microbacterium sp.]|nr:dTDP-Rha--alpha-D-GlcNAc-pyrophosphate polyprenol alpha-3-L-rhamnosyltransferase [Microbacterium sp.]MBA4346839.1 dTDP-Rha--alpha-D-GlcNAc-pyrophosphate polyprenol alpha-3-L-rhamnosyltransferase [Microbacterium sp.]
MESEAEQPTRVGIVTVAFRSDRVLEPFLQSVLASTGVHLSIVVADNCPADGEGARQLAAHAGATYVPLDANPGYGAAVNAGVATLDDDIEWVLVSNPDVTLTPETIATLLATGRSDATIGAVGPCVLNSDGSVYPSARAIPSLRTGVGHALLVRVWPTNPFTRRYHDAERTGGERRDAGWLSGACLLVRRSAFTRIGGFDEGYFMYFEDVDLGFRLARAGLRSVYEPLAVVTHDGAHSTEGESGLMIRAHHDSARRFLAAKYRGPLLWPLRAVLDVGLRVRATLLVRAARR